MPKIEVEINDKSYMIYAVYENPARRVYLCKCDEDTYKAMVNYFWKQLTVN